MYKQVLPKGKFVYRRDLTGAPIPGKYNMLRHCGAIWSLALYEQFLGKKASSKSVVAACEYARERIVRCVFGEEKTPVLLILDKGEAKLGGNALALLAYSLVKPVQTEAITGLTAGLGCFNDKDTGAIRFSKFNPQTGYVSDFVSEYYPGEAALAYATVGDIERAYKLIVQLKLQRDKDSVLQDHWLLQAIELVDKHLPADDVAARGFLKDYARLIFDEIVANPYYLERSTPLACRAEALVAYLGMLGRDAVYRQEEHFLEVRDFCHFLLLELKKHQQTKGMLAGAFIEGKGTRIDYTQHAMTAYLRYVQLKDELRSKHVVL
ncbi:hypothetical protein [Alishewanella longhuensis]|nr:hypothetical protein [Alishewanella longhuensis]